MRSKDGLPIGTSFIMQFHTIGNIPQNQYSNMRPTLDELDDFLCGKADEETRQRIGTDLLNHESPLRLFVEGSRTLAENLLGGEKTDDGGIEIRAQVQAALLRRNKVGNWQWIIYFVTHSIVWLISIIALFLGTVIIFNIRYEGLWIGVGICTIGFALDVSMAVRRKRPSQGTVWESLQGAILGISPWGIALLAVEILSFCISISPVVLSCIRPILSLMILISGFGCSVFGLIHGFGLRAKVAAGKTTMARVLLHCISAVFADSGSIWIVALLCGVAFGLESLKVILFLFTTGLIIGNILDSPKKDYTQPMDRFAGIIGLVGTLSGMSIGLFIEMTSYGSHSISSWDFILGSAWCVGSMSFASALWLRIHGWEKLLDNILHLLAAIILGVAVPLPFVVFMAHVHSLFGRMPWLHDYLEPVLFLMLTAIGTYLGFTDKWLYVLPKNPQVWLHQNWTRWIADEQHEILTRVRMHTALFAPHAVVAQVSRDYRIMVDAFIALRSE
jgi:hypothetical protein